MINRALPCLSAGTAVLLVAFALAVSPRAALSAEAPAYMALGDSLAFGVGAANPAAEGYVALTADALAANDEFEDGLELVNLSEPGATSSDLLEPDGQLDQALQEIASRAEDEEPNDAVEIISIDIGGNDLLQLAQPDSPCFDDAAGGPCRNALNEMLSNLQGNLTQTLARLREAAPEAEIYVIDLFNPYSGTGEAVEVVADIGVQQVNGVIAAASANEDLDVRFVSVYELFEDRGQEWVASDGIHPNNDGHRVLAEALTAAIEGRNIVLPPDIATPPPDTPVEDDPDGNDVSLTLAVVLIAVSFLAGGFVSSAYFVMRGR